jgi:hypothetical protein
MEPYTRADKRKLAFGVIVFLAFSIAIAGSIGWGSVLVAKATLSGARAMLGV